MDYKNVLGWDILAYYLYLPFTFIYGDPGISDQSIIKYIFDTYNPSGTFYQAYPLPNGNWSPMYTLGFAILYLPFFLIGHLWALLSSYPADGFSYPYQFSISNGVMLYIAGGIFVFRKFLLTLFSDRLVSFILLAMILGTSLFHESIVYEVGPHAMMFAGFSAILYLTHLWHKKANSKNSFLLGFIIGLCILARGSGIFVLFIPVLWGVYNKDTLLQKLNYLIANYRFLIIGLIGFSIAPLIQIIYWKFITGEYIFNTYQVTPGFDWFDPHFQKVFFSYKKGWLLYTPMITFCILGLFALWKQNKQIAIAVITFFIVNVYVISSWGTWWQGGSFGSRYFVDSYAILAIPFGYFARATFKTPVWKYLFSLLVTFFIFLNLFQTWQFNNWILDGYAMTKEYYWRVFLKTKVSEEDRKYAEIVRKFEATDSLSNPEDYNHRTAGFLNFEEVNTIQVPDFMITDKHAKSPPHACIIHPDWVYGPTFRFPFYKLTDKEHAWLHVTFDYLSEFTLNESPAQLVIELDHNEGQYIEKRRDYYIKSDTFNIGEWNHFEVKYLTPYPLSVKNDVIKVYIYVTGANPIYIDNFQVEIYERKW
jgi:hypothetical protein